jgi:hypothetical protein
MKTRFLVASLLALAATGSIIFAQSPAEAAPAPPDILFLLADDWGWGDLN